MSDLDWAEILDDDEISSDKQQDLDKDELSFSHKLHKTEEEINKFAVDEGLDEVERALLLLKYLSLT